MPLKHTKIFLCLIHGNPKSEKGKNMFIPDEFIQELKSKTDIVDVVSGYVQLKKQGKNMLGLCPFHSEKTPSFNVSTDKNFFHCFGCKASGDVITFIRLLNFLHSGQVLKSPKAAGKTAVFPNSATGYMKPTERLQGFIINAFTHPMAKMPLNICITEG